MKTLIKHIVNKQAKTVTIICYICGMFFIIPSCTDSPISENNCANTTPQRIIAKTDNINYQYPVRPGTVEWGKFDTGDQMLAACQLPIDILNNVSTKELIYICLDNPLYAVFAEYDDDRIGIKWMIDSFNGLKELSQREDSSLELMNVYADFPIIKETQMPFSEGFHTPYKIIFLELLLSNDIFIKRFDDLQAIKLNNIIVDKYENKLNCSNVYSSYNIKKTALLWAMNIVANVNNRCEPSQINAAQKIIDEYIGGDINSHTEITQFISKL